jgi:sugar lactone lactonase YvrE
MRIPFLLSVLGAGIPIALSAQAARVDRTAYAFARDSAFARPINRSTIAFVLPEKDLLAENVAYDPRDGSFFVGSTRHGKIVRRARDGRVTDFAPSGRDGMWMVIGMKVDTARSSLWVNSSGGSNYVRHASTDAGKAALFRFDLATGRLLARYAPSEAGAHFFNDLVIDRRGTVYLTDMAAGAIYVLDPSADRLTVWSRPTGFSDPNGIALSGDGRTLYVVSDEGVNAFDAATRARTILSRPDSIDVLGVDGLYWMNGSLVGIQGWRRNRVQRFTLSEDRARITGAVVLEANHPMFMNPTTGVVVGDELYYVANSQFGSFSPDGSLFTPERLFETVTLRVRP